MDELELNGTINSSLVQQVRDTTPTKNAGKTPLGRITVAEKWKHSELCDTLRKLLQIVFTEEPGSVIDFYPSSNVAVVYISEAECILGNQYRRKLAKLRNAHGIRGVVLFEKTNVTNQYFISLQQFAVLDLGLVLLTVANQSEAAHLLAQIVALETKNQNNPFLVKRTLPSFDEMALNTVRTIPGLGEVKSKQLLQHFKSIINISQATIEELTPVIGRGSAHQVWSFFSP